MRVVAVYSTKGGVGKTTAAVSLAYEASRSNRVLLWDLDPQGATTFILQVKPKLRDGVDALVKGKTSLHRAIRSTAYEGLDVLPADDSYRELEHLFDAAKKQTHQIAHVLDRMADDYDVVILDCPPGSSLVAENAVYGADVVVVPLVPSPLSLRSLDQVLQVVAESKRPVPVVGFLSMVDRRKSAHRAAVDRLAAHRPEVSDIVVPATVIVERMGYELAPIGVYASRSDAAVAYRDLWSLVSARVS
ncbi:AAA family ATPase [Conyzicola nivalis]|uniref:Cobyrinic acid a,c-diamide synthase n=1 Tax=Conyzicola nivalis TaxID=1477021 RepID=A0A916SFS5_9MICO|nr:ParA family protein [Conyzicola nivalis]GGA97022.1 cobyrinic acid a,c-diamide synthase [Conyzicola nivalis]